MIVNLGFEKTHKSSCNSIRLVCLQIHSTSGLILPHIPRLEINFVLLYFSLQHEFLSFPNCHTSMSLCELQKFIVRDLQPLSLRKGEGYSHVLQGFFQGFKLGLLTYDNVCQKKGGIKIQCSDLKYPRSLGLQFNKTYKHFMHLMYLPTSQIWLALDNLFKSIYECTSKQWWILQQHMLFFCFSSQESR